MNGQQKNGKPSRMAQTLMIPKMKLSHLSYIKIQVMKKFYCSSRHSRRAL